MVNVVRSVVATTTANPLLSAVTTAPVTTVMTGMRNASLTANATIPLAPTDLTAMGIADRKEAVATTVRPSDAMGMSVDLATGVMKATAKVVSTEAMIDSVQSVALTTDLAQTGVHITETMIGETATTIAVTVILSARVATVSAATDRIAPATTAGIMTGPIGLGTTVATMTARTALATTAEIMTGQTGLVTSAMVIGLTRPGPIGSATNAVSTIAGILATAHLEVAGVTIAGIMTVAVKTVAVMADVTTPDVATPGVTTLGPGSATAIREQATTGRVGKAVSIETIAGTATARVEMTATNNHWSVATGPVTMNSTNASPMSSVKKAATVG